MKYFHSPSFLLDEILLTLSKSFALTMVKCTSVSKAQKKHSCIEGANIEKDIFWSKCFGYWDSILDTRGHLAESVSCLWSFQDRLGATLLRRAQDRHPLVANVCWWVYVSIYVNQMFLYVALRRVAVGSSQVHQWCSEPPCTFLLLRLWFSTIWNILPWTCSQFINETQIKDIIC